VIELHRLAELRELTARVCSWIAGQLLGVRTGTTTPALAVRRVRLVEEWVDAHAADPITLGRLCAVAGVGDRYLETAFRAQRGQTPMQFVAARRLARVRCRLLDAKPGDSVTRIAQDAGIVHLGRFAVRYRSVYRESPSTTLRRSLDRS